MIVPAVPSVAFDPPDTFYTVHIEQSDPASQNPLSLKVIKAIDAIVAGTAIRARAFGSFAEAKAVAGPRSVAIFDYAFRAGDFSPRQTTDVTTAPEWARGTHWSVLVKPQCGKNDSRIYRCASQVAAMFGERIFLERIGVRQYPWGMPKRGTDGPSEYVVIDPVVIESRLAALNSGPHLADAIADRSFAAELPPGSRISWVRVLPEPLGYSAEAMQSVVTALRRFEIASHELLRQDGDVQRAVLSGVTLREPRLSRLYLDPGVDCFSVARPDLHWTESGLCASENDEMPGGMPELVLLDKAYGMNEQAWAGFFGWLTSTGPLLFLVSHEWSKCYIPEIRWLVGHLKSLGYDARMLTTDCLDDLEIGPSGVIHEGDKVGAIWRQFPIFETAGKLADIVELARRGSVRLYPEWAHFGNKAWFHLFTRYQSWFAERLGPDDMSLLRGTLPESHMVSGEESFPIFINGARIGSVFDLVNLLEADRDRLVMKVCGANGLAARSYGVLMGRGIKGSAWSAWVGDRLAAHEPFLVQNMFNPGVVKVPVWHTGKGQSEMFRCKVLMRPWVREGQIVSVHACAVPREFHKVHGMVSMAVSPVRLV